MIILQILFWIFIVFVALMVLLYFVEPSLIALPYSILLKLIMKNPPFLDVDKAFPEHKILEENWETIRGELIEILKESQNIPEFHDIDKIQKYISAKGDNPWRVYVLKAYDNWSEANCQRAPKTVALLKQFPQLTSVMFSILEGKKHIPPHYGFYKGVLRYHLGLIVPKDKPCYIVCGGEKHSWTEGKGVLFDDTYLHEVWNESDETRVVLFCDLYRQDIPKLIRPLNKWVYNLRVKSRRLKSVIAKAEVPQNI